MDFESHPSRYRHWKLALDGDIARLTLSVKEDAPFVPGYVLKLNSYDLGVDIELNDAVQRIRFEHPEVKVVVVGSDRDRVFSAGANIQMLASSSHPFKVNFCKYTNETRLAMEDSSSGSGLKWVAALSGTCAGGGYELALACDEIILVDDGASTVSLPEVPLLGVLPGTGGLTRLTDKRKVRRDLADVFCTVAEGIKGKRAVDWRLVDKVVPRSRFAAAVDERARALAAAAPARKGPGIELDRVRPYRHVDLSVKGRVAELTVRAPATTPSLSEGPAFWPLRAFREIDDALLRIRFEHEQVGVVLIRTRGDAAQVLAADELLAGEGWLARETRLLVARVLRRLDATARTLFAIADKDSCFVGSLLELALAADRTYMLAGTTVQAGPLQAGALPGDQGSSRLALRWLSAPDRVGEVVAALRSPTGAEEAFGAGVATVVADDIDFDDEVRVAVEERLSLSADALTGLEQNLRVPGVETTATRVFGRLSAWQNWIFTRPNATGERGALTMYGKPERPQLDPRRT